MAFFLLRQKQKKKQNGDKVGLLVFVCLSGAQNETEKPKRLWLIDWTSGLGHWWQIKALGIAQKTNLPEAPVYDLFAEARDPSRKYCGQFLKVQHSATGHCNTATLPLLLSNHFMRKCYLVFSKYYLDHT